MDFSVVIPTYNGAQRLPGVLEKLRSQTGTEEIDWEIIIVDNNSSDETAQIVQNLQKTWQLKAPLIYVFEPRQGLAFARQLGIQTSKGVFVGFLDDDNFPSSNWVLESFKFGKNNPLVGAYGGKVVADFEVAPTQNLKQLEGFLALRERGSKPNKYQPEILSLPTGAGLVVRKQAWCENVPEQLKLIGRVHGSMLGGEDWEALLHIHKAGWEIWYNPAMQIEHKIPKYRLEKEYLLSVIHGSCLAFCPLKMMIAKPWQKPVILTRTFLGNLYNALLHYVKYHNQLKTNLIAECEMKIYLSRIESFFYFLKSK